MVTVQGDESQSLRTFLDSKKTGKSPGENLHLKRGKEEIFNCKFSKVNALRKGKSGTKRKNLSKSLAKLNVKCPLGSLLWERFNVLTV